MLSTGAMEAMESKGLQQVEHPVPKTLVLLGRNVQGSKWPDTPAASLRWPPFGAWNPQWQRFALDSKNNFLGYTGGRHLRMGTCCEATGLFEKNKNEICRCVWQASSQSPASPFIRDTMMWCSLAAAGGTIWAMVQIIGHHHIEAHILISRRHSYTLPTTTDTLAHVEMSHGRLSLQGGLNNSEHTVDDSITNTYYTIITPAVLICNNREFHHQQ